MVIKKLVPIAIVLAALFSFVIIAVATKKDTAITKEISMIPTSTPTHTPSPTPTNTPTPTPTPIWSNNYPVHKNIFATMFWVGEKATGANDYIPNEASAWDTHWMENFGGIDNPYSRNGYYPHDFKPKENPFYFALPYNDYNATGRKENASSIYWYFAPPDNYSLLKNRWIRIKHKDNICYGQWQDVGPFEDDDVDYVFGNNRPKNDRAGIDLSPALRHCLEMATNGNVDWQFVNEDEVPTGPWKEIVTTSQVNWR